ncbi:NAD(P)/FAD-dependent oxidoreductase [Embleya sp. NPDC020886]|uniref:NAD(P)/FAD-dependent oxidoreductase n=1 Tax=Embleya sp. NPDC020886 TaxID=3363980 RepID=UPI00379CE220
MGNTTEDVRIIPADNGAYDVVVVGAGAAGLSTALLLARARRRVAVVDDGNTRNAAHTHGFASRDGMAAADLLAVGRAEIGGHGVDLIEGRIGRIDPGFLVHLDGGATIGARRIVMATGLRDELPAIPGVRELWGSDVLFCLHCHAHEIRDRPIGVLGTHPGAVRHALLLCQWSYDVVYFPHDRDLAPRDRRDLEAHGVTVAEGTVKRLVTENDRLRGVELVQGQVFPRGAVFVVPDTVPHDTPLTGPGCERPADGWARTDAAGRTGVFGMWSVGNVADPKALVITAAIQGAAAAFALDQDLEQAVDTHDTTTRTSRDVPRPMPQVPFPS